MSFGSGKPRNKAEQARFDRIKAGPCIACLQRGIDLTGQGLVEVVTGYWASRDGYVVSRKTGQGSKGVRVLKPNLTETGYLRVQLRVAGRPMNRFIHALVAQAFIGERGEGMQVNHIDGDKQNNRLENLEYVTRRENMDHAVKTGLTMVNHAKGAGHWNAKYSEELVSMVRLEHARITSDGPAKPGAVAELADRAGMPTSTLQNIVSRASWAHIP